MLHVTGCEATGLTCNYLLQVRLLQSDRGGPGRYISKELGGKRYRKRERERDTERQRETGKDRDTARQTALQTGDLL